MSSISAGTATGSALVSAGDTTGNLVLQVNGTTPSVSLAANGSIGVGSTPGYGTTGQVLASRGSGTAPAWTGGLVLVSTVTASASSFLEFTGLSGSNQYFFVFNNLLMSSAASFSMTVGTGAGPTYLTSNYGYYGLGNNSALALSATGTTSALTTSMILGNINWSWGTPTPFSFNGVITGLTSGRASMTFQGISNSSTGSTYVQYSGGGGFNTNDSATTPITAIKVTPSTGTITSGTASLYRLGV